MRNRKIFRSPAAAWFMLVPLLISVLFISHPARASSAPSDVQVNKPFDGPFPTNRTAEPTIAQNPTNPKNIIVGSNDEIKEPPCTDTTPSVCQAVAGISLSGFYASFDGGKTFPCQGLIDLSAFGKWAEGDPWVAFDSRGNAYYGTLAFDTVATPPLPPTADVFVAKSTDGGCTWPTAAKVSGTSPSIYDDKDAIAADAHVNSPFRDNVYVSWTKFAGGNNGAAQIMFSRSTDGGVTWDNPQGISNAEPARGRQGANIQVGPDGTVYVVWTDNTSHGQLVQKMAISYDGGKTFPKSNIIVAIVTDDVPDGILPGTRFVANGIFPSMSIAPNGTIYVAWSNHTNGHAVVLFTKSTDGGQTWSTPIGANDVTGRSSALQAVSVDPNGKINVVSTAIDDVPVGTAPGAGVVHYDTYWTQSTDGGVTFSSPVKISKVTSDPDGSSTHRLDMQFIGDYISAASDASHVYAVWTDSRNATPCAAVDAYRAGTGLKPDVITQCPVTFGNTDIFLATVSY